MDKKKLEQAFQDALASRGKNKGMLKAKCPPMGTLEAVVWQAITSIANPYKVGFMHLFFMSEEHKEVYDSIVSAIKNKGIDVRSLDRDRKVLDLLGVF